MNTIKIESHGEVLDTWVFPPPVPKPYAAIILAHGLGGTIDLRLDTYARHFAAAGFLAVAFDYRYFGASTGQPRGLIDPDRQLQDWHAVIAHVSSMPNVDPARIGIFGTSFSGGHVIRLAAEIPSIKAVISQVPFTSGPASALVMNPFCALRLSLSALYDYLFGAAEPTRVNLCGKPGDLAFMPTEDAIPGMHSILPDGQEGLRITAVPARLALKLPFIRPGSYASKVKQPILFVIAGNDSVAPSENALAWAKQAPRAEILYLNGVGHFDPYTGELFDKLVRQYITFYKDTL